MLMTFISQNSKCYNISIYLLSSYIVHLHYVLLFFKLTARSLCEKQKALFDDAINILNGTINPYNGHTVAEMQAFVKFIVQAVDAEAIQILNCTDKGFFAKVQCSVSIYYCNIVHILLSWFNFFQLRRPF